MHHSEVSIELKEVSLFIVKKIKKVIKANIDKKLGSIDSVPIYLFILYYFF